MTNSDIHVRSRIDSEVRSESYAAATKQEESRASTTRALPLDSSHRTRLRSASDCGSRAFFYFIAVTQIFLVTTASTTHQPQNVGSTRNQPVQTRLSSNAAHGIPSTSTILEDLSWPVPTQTPTPLRSASTKRSVYLSSSSSSSTALRKISSVKPSTLPTPSLLTTAMPPSKLFSSSSHIKTPTTESTTKSVNHEMRTSYLKSSQATTLRNPDYLVTTKTLRKGDLVYLKRQMDFQRQEIRQLRLQLSQNNDQMTTLQREFREFCKQQQQMRNVEPTIPSSPTEKHTQTTLASFLISPPEPEDRSTSLREMLDPLLHLTPLQKEQEVLTNAYTDPMTSPDPLLQPETSTKRIQAVTTASEKETPSKSRTCSDCSKNELRLSDLQREFDLFQKQVNATFRTILIQLAHLKSESQEIPEAGEYRKEESTLKVKKTEIKSAEDEIVDVKDDTGSRKEAGIKSGVMNDAANHAALSKQKISSRTEGEGVLPTTAIDSGSRKHRTSQIWSGERDSGGKGEDKERAESSKEDTDKDDVNYRHSDDMAQELESISQKVQLISDRLEDLEDQLVFVKENTSLSIKHVKDTLRGNISLLESHNSHSRLDGEKKGFDQEKISSTHNVSDHTIKDSGQRTFSKKNDTEKKEKVHSSTRQRVLSKSFLQTGQIISGSDMDKLSGKRQFQSSYAKSVHRNFSWLFENFQSMQNEISHLDNAMNELSITLSKLAVRFPFAVEERNATLDGIISAATEKSTSDHLGRLLNEWPTTIREEKSGEKGYQNKSFLKDDQSLNDTLEQETNTSQGVSVEKILAVNQSEEWKSGSQMISDSAEQFPEGTHSMLEALMSWINDLDAQIQKLKIAADEMKTKIIYMLSTTEQMYPKEPKADEKDEAEKRPGSSLQLNSTLAKTSQIKKGNSLPGASSASPPTTSISRQLTSSTALLANISDVHERFLRNRSIGSIENSSMDISDSTTQNYHLYNFTELESFEVNKSITVTPAPVLSTSTDESVKEIIPLPTDIRITDSQNTTLRETDSLATVLDNIQSLIKRVKKLESQVLDLSEEKLLEANDSGLHIQTDYMGSGITEEVPAASLEMINKIAFNMSSLQTQIADIKSNVSSQENQLNAVKNDVFILDENMDYLGRELSDLELKQRRDDRFYHSQQITEANLSLSVVASEVSQILAPKQQLTNQNLKELNESLSKQWLVLNRLMDTTTQQETNISKIAQNVHFSQEKILYVDLTKRAYRIYNSTSVQSCNSMKDADRSFLNKKTQTCYYGYGNKKMLPYNAAKRKCEDAGLHIVFMETEEEREYVAKEITQEIGGHWIGAEMFSHGWYWVRGCDALDPIVNPPWRYNHSVNYSRAIIWGDKWSGKFPGQYCRFVCEEEPFKEEICDGFRSFERVNEWSSDAFFRSFNTLHEVDCGRLCLADPSCKGFRFRKSGHHKCALYNRSNTTTKTKIRCDAPREVCYTRIELCFS